MHALIVTISPTRRLLVLSHCLVSLKIEEFDKTSPPFRTQVTGESASSALIIISCFVSSLRWPLLLTQLKHPRSNALHRGRCYTRTYVVRLLTM